MKKFGLAISTALALLVSTVSYAAPVPAGPSEEKLKETLTKLNDLKTIKATEAELQKLLKDKPTCKLLVATAKKMQDGAKKDDPPFKFNAMILIGKLAQNVKENKTAEQFYKACRDEALKLEKGSEIALAYDALIELNWSLKQYNKVEDLCKELIDTDGDAEELQTAKFFSLERIIRVKSRLGEHEDAIKKANAFLQITGGGWYGLQVKATALREAEKYDDAIDAYNDALTSLKKDKRMKDEDKKRYTRNVRYMMTAVYVDNKNVDKAAEILQELIKEEPDSATFHNDLGFIWCDHDMKLEESEKLIRKALELDKVAREKALKEGKIDEESAKKENAAYLDSLGWVLFKNKKYEEAKKYLLESIKDDEEGAHMEIWDHLADVYMALGETKLAVETWQKALKLEDISKRDVERRKKITEKMRKAKASLKTEEK